MYLIRDLLDFLDGEDREAIDRLCEIRGVDRWRRAAKCSSLARSYGGEHEQLFRDLRQEDLRELLETPTEIDGQNYVLPSDASYSKAKLVQIALACLRRDEVAPELERISDDESDEDDDEDDDGGGWREGDERPFEFDEAASLSRPRDYQRELITALEAAVKRSPPGKRLRITVATGGGKTRIANDWIWEHALPQKRRVLWITKDWTLLRQSAGDLCRRRRAAQRRLGYVGDAGSRQLGGLVHGVRAEVVYTTIHTWRSRKESDFERATFDAVVIDESHWGEGKGAFRDLHKKYRDTAVFVGLTATPRQGTGFALVGREYDYRTLANMGVLAKPIYEPPVRTGIAWAPVRSTSHGDVDAASLAKLARSKRRNALIVDTYIKKRDLFGKTLIFACDIEHASDLTDALHEKGNVAAEALHSGMNAEDRRAVVRRFTDGRTRVLVNVAMMTHGVDIPDIKTIFLARPTSSKTLFAQMVGRAVRKTEAKTHFHLVDFVDSVEAHGEVLVSPTKYFGDLVADSGKAAKYRPSPRRAAHTFAKAPFEHVPSLPGYEEIQGLDIQPEQTFGIEFELTRDGFEPGTRPRDWRRVANQLLEAIPAGRAQKAYVDYHDEAKDHSVWNVEFDGSCGWEVTSRILSGASGFREIVEVCRALQSEADVLGLTLTPKTGTHVHLGWEPKLVALRRLMRLVSHFEPALFSLVAPSRSGNPYCKPVRRHLAELLALPSLRAWKERFADREQRYLTVNPSNLFGGGLGTLEVRLHSGTIEGPKILGWLSLWMRLLAAAQGTVPIPEEKLLWRELPLTAGSQGDISELAELVMANTELSTYLRDRRSVVMEQWFKHPQHGDRARAASATWP